MDDMWTRVGMHLIARVSGPMKFRFVLQPLMAAVFAIRSGLADAKTGKPPYGWALLWEPGHRADMLKNGWGNSHRGFPPGDRALPAHTWTGQPSGSKEDADDNSVGPTAG